ncbi:MAG: PfkB family carbohydrate kinase [Bacillota bacterium]
MQFTVTVAGAAAIGDYIFTVDHLPEPGEIVTITDYSGELIAGGCAPNIAVDSATLGLRVQLYYPVGNDFAQTGLQERWEALGIACNLTQVPYAPSGCSWVFMQPDGKTMCFANPGAAALARPIIEKPFSEWVVIAPVLNEYTLICIEKAIAQKCKIIVTGIGNESLMSYMPHLHTLILNEREGKELCESTGLTSIAQLAARYKALHVFETHGGNGSFAYFDGKEYKIPIAKAQRAFDFTGAGDAYTSGVLYAFVNGLNIEQAGHIGALCASFTVETSGGQKGLPDKAMLASRMKTQFPHIAAQISFQ